MQTAITPGAPGPDTPVPYTLTAKAHAYLDRAAPARVDEPAAVDDTAGWCCGRCGSAWFGPVPGDGLCGPCRSA